MKKFNLTALEQVERYRMIVTKRYGDYVVNSFRYINNEIFGRMISIDTMENVSFNIPDTGIKIKKNDAIRLYQDVTTGQNIGADLNGEPLYFLSSQERRDMTLKVKQHRINKAVQDYKKNKRKLDAAYNKLPIHFKKRIDKFRKNNINFRIDYETYEMMCCVDAVKIYKQLKTSKKIEKWAKLSWKEQKKQVHGLDKGHSGNSFFMATNLAWIYSRDKNGVVKLYGALAPLVGSEEYGCVPNPNHEKKYPREVYQ